MSRGLAFVLIFAIFTIQIFDFLHLGYHFIEDNITLHSENDEHSQLKHSACLVDSTIEYSHNDNCQTPNQIDYNIQFETNGIIDLVSIGLKNEFHNEKDNSCLGHNQTHLFFSELNTQINLKLDYACQLGHLVLKLNFVKELDKYFDDINISKLLKITTNFLDFSSNNFYAYSNKAPPLF